jgi:hypothetical protein
VPLIYVIFENPIPPSYDIFPLQTNLFVTSTNVSLTYENRTYPINTTCGKNADILKFKASGYIRQPFLKHVIVATWAG